MISKLSIDPTAFGGPLAGARVEIDGTDISSATTSLKLDIKAGHLPKVELDLVVLIQPMELDDPVIIVPEQTSNALTALGWLNRDTAELMEHRLAEHQQYATEADQLLHDAVELIDGLDLGVESDGCAAMVRRIRAHLTPAPVRRP